MSEYISREEVVRYLKGYSDKECNSNSPYGMITSSVLNKVERALSEMPAADVQPVNQWISVDDKLPDTVYDCLVWYSCDTAFGKSKSVGISFCSRCDWYKKHLNGDNIVVLYWMPLPEPPKDGDTNG